MKQNIIPGLVKNLQEKIVNNIDFWLDSPLFIDADSFNIMEQKARYTLDTLNVKNGIIPHAHFYSLDFAITETDGKATIKLVEAQPFPSVFSSLLFIEMQTNEAIKSAKTNIDERIHWLKTSMGYTNNTKLLEINPKNQTTYFDFMASNYLFGTQIVDISHPIEESFLNTENTFSNRIVPTQLNAEEINKVELLLNNKKNNWIGKPDDFNAVNKRTLMCLNDTDLCTGTYQANNYPVHLDLANYVLKPVDGFGGKGVYMDVTKQLLSTLDMKGMILQRKINYTNSVVTPSGDRRMAELRFMYATNTAGETIHVTTMVRTNDSPHMNLNTLSKKPFCGVSIAGYA